MGTDDTYVPGGPKKTCLKFIFILPKKKENSDKKLLSHSNLSYYTPIKSKFISYFSLFSKLQEDARNLLKMTCAEMKLVINLFILD